MITDLSGFTCSQAATYQQNQRLRPHRLSLLAIWQNKDNPGQRSNKMRDVPVCEISLIWPSVSIATCDMAPLSPQDSNLSRKIQDYSLYFKRLKLHIHFYTYTFTSWNTSGFTYLKKRLDSYIIFLFSSMCFPHFLFSLTLALQFPYVSLPPLSCSLCFSFHVLPFMSLIFTFFYLPHPSPFANFSSA